ncbi:MAG TPA: flagellar biosynthesis protein FlhB [Spirochaetota bacterium]|nr:flagellar biosynthesis protein FlhB [Spirochaetota bacterium]
MNIFEYDIMLEYPESRLPKGLNFDLQLFSAEEEGRTEEPTEKKLREAREKGQTAKTDELTQAITVIFGFMVIFFLGGWILETIIKMTIFYLSSFSNFTLTKQSIFNEFIAVASESGKILLPIFVTAFVAAFVGNVIQVGFQFSSHPLKLDFSKIKFDPATIMKKVLFSKQVAMNLFKSLFKVLAIGIVCYLVISSDYEVIINSPDIGISMALKAVSITGLKIIIWSAVLLLVLSIPDYYFQKQEFIESLKMTKQETKEEMKETLGDPQVKARLQEMQRELVMKNMIQEVPKADVVVTNPTHYAVALKYDRTAMDAPVIIAKGADSIALRIREIAKENEIMLIENRYLAREMYNRLDIGDMIPEDLFYAVSLVYAELYKKQGFKEAI